MSLKDTYIQYGVPSNWAADYEIKGISASTYKSTSTKNLLQKYKIPLQEIAFVKNCLTRQPIDEHILQRLLERNRFVCCLCKGQKSDSYVIHHIIEYSISKDNSYDNLAVVCPNDHDSAHKEGVSLTNKISAKQIKTAKKNWEAQVIIENKKKALKTNFKQKKNWKDENPFKLLQSYSETDQKYFFGRESEIAELLTKVKRFNIVGLFGESGTGKTSLLNAGLIPKLKIDDFIILSVRCLDEPIKRIREALFNELTTLNFSNIDIAELSAADTFAHLIVKLKAILCKRERRLIILIDQFEELFTRARELEKEYIAKGINEALIVSESKDRIFFLFSLREDYIGELWDWAHLYHLEDAWIHQYRIKRLSEKRAVEAISQPLEKLNINVDRSFVDQIVYDLKIIGNGLIYPPYLQIACSELFEEYKYREPNDRPALMFDKQLLKDDFNTETIIANYLSESMLHDLTEEEKLQAQGILDLLTGSEGLRNFLSLSEIARYLLITEDNTKHVIEHLIKRKIVHAIVEDDKTIGYELVHDFLSKKFFDKLGIEAKRTKTTVDIFRRAHKEYKQHGVLASRDHLEILHSSIKQLILDKEEWLFLIKSSFSVYWYFENRWTQLIELELLTEICLDLINDKSDRIVEQSIITLGRSRNHKIAPILIEIIESSTCSIQIRDVAINQFSYNITNKKVITILEEIIKKEKSYKLRKSAVYAYARNLSNYSKTVDSIPDERLTIIYNALNDSMTQVRKQAADVLSYLIVTERSITPLINRLRKESSINSRKAIVSALGSLLRRHLSEKLIVPILQNISSNDYEDYRVKEEAKFVLSTYVKGNKIDDIK